MEKYVVQIASGLLSGNFDAFFDAVDCIEIFRREASLQTDYFRLLQELLAFDRGAVISKLVQQITQKPSGDESAESGRLLHGASFFALAALTESPTIAKFCVTKATNLRQLAKVILEAHAWAVRRVLKYDPVLSSTDGSGEMQSAAKRVALQSLRCFLNLSRASRSFRLVVPGLQGVFSTFGSLASANVIKRLNMVELVQLSHWLVYLTYSFAMSQDSKDWALENGLIPMFVAFLTSPSPNEHWKSCDAHDRSKPGWNSEIDGHGTIMRAGAQRLLDYEKMLKTEQIPFVKMGLRAELFRILEGCMGGLREIYASRTDQTSSSETSRRLLTGDEDSTKAQVAAVTGLNDVPIVCSMEDCKAESELDAGRRFSKCAACGLAFYCSKEHQKLHWKTHKRQCQQSS